MRMCLKFLKISIPFYIILLIIMSLFIFLMANKETISEEMDIINNVGVFVHDKLSVLKFVLEHHMSDIFKEEQIPAALADSVVFISHIKDGVVIRTIGNSPFKVNDIFYMIENLEEGFEVSDLLILSKYLLFICRDKKGDYLTGIDVIKLLPNWIFNFESFKIIGKNGVIIFDSSDLSWGRKLPTIGLTLTELTSKHYIRTKSKVMVISKPTYGIYLIGELSYPILFKRTFDKLKNMIIIFLITIVFLVATNCYTLQREFNRSLQQIDSILTFNSDVSNAKTVKSIHDEIIDIFKKRIRYFRALYAFVQKLYQLDETEGIIELEEDFKEDRENDIKKIFYIVSHNYKTIFPNAYSVALYVKKGKDYKLQDSEGDCEIFRSQKLQIIEGDKVEKILKNLPVELNVTKEILNLTHLDEYGSVNLYSLVILDEGKPISIIIIAFRKMEDKGEEELLKVIWMELNMAYSKLRRLRLLRKHSSIDYLTDIFNRRFFMQRLKEEIHRAKRKKEVFSVSIVDVNWLKYVNDNFGHEAGDKLLKKVASELKRFKRESDVVGRIGGDEFGVIWIGVGGDQIDMVEKRLYSHFDNIFLENYNVEVSISIGSAVYGIDGTTSNELLRVADERMYERKRIFKMSRDRPRIK